MKREDVIREIMSMIDAGGYQVARAILKLAGKPEGTFQKIGPRSRRRSMSQAEAKRLVDKARARIELVDSTD